MFLTILIFVLLLIIVAPLMIKGTTIHTAYINSISDRNINATDHFCHMFFQCMVVVMIFAIFGNILHIFSKMPWTSLGLIAAILAIGVEIYWTISYRN